MELPKFKPEWKQGRRYDNLLCSIRKSYLLCNIIAWLKDKIEGTKFALPALSTQQSHLSRDLEGFPIYNKREWASTPGCQPWRRGSHSIGRDHARISLRHYLPMLTVRNEPFIDDVSTSYTVYRTPTQFVLSEICATPGWRSTGRSYWRGINSTWRCSNDLVSLC